MLLVDAFKFINLVFLVVLLIMLLRVPSRDDIKCAT